MSVPDPQNHVPLPPERSDEIIAVRELSEFETTACIAHKSLRIVSDAG